MMRQPLTGHPRGFLKRVGTVLNAPPRAASELVPCGPSSLFWMEQGQAPARPRDASQQGLWLVPKASREPTVSLRGGSRVARVLSPLLWTPGAPETRVPQIFYTAPPDPLFLSSNVFPSESTHLCHVEAALLLLVQAALLAKNITFNFWGTAEIATDPRLSRELATSGCSSPRCR